MNYNTHICLVLEMKRDGRLSPLGKHEAHPPHLWWYTSWGGGHQLEEDWMPEVLDHGGWSGWDKQEGNVRRWHCPGRNA
jgi:hypothetical protein